MSDKDADTLGESDEPSDPSESETLDEDGSENPIQKDEEGIKEVAEATSKNSEDVHGGDEATKDIKDSPNAANDGENEDNQGAESGRGNGPNELLNRESWESSADNSAVTLQLQDNLKGLEAKMRKESGHRTSKQSHQFNQEDHSPEQLEIAFKEGRDLILKLAAEEDFTRKEDGRARWDAKAIVQNVVSFRHPRIPVSRYERPKEAGIAVLLDISDSCAQQAEMFMAIAAGAIGHGVRVYVGYNGSCRASELRAPRKVLRSYKQADSWVEEELYRIAGRRNDHLGDWLFEEFIERIRPKTCIIFGDWDGIDQYQDVVHRSRYRSIKFFWIANEGRRCKEEVIPENWTRKNYFPGVYTPRDLVAALKKLK